MTSSRGCQPAEIRRRGNTGRFRIALRFYSRGTKTHMNRLLRLVVAGLALVAFPQFSALAQDNTSTPDASMAGMSGMAMDHSPGTAPSAMMIIPMMHNPMLPGM